jgi:hypothetical protein
VLSAHATHSDRRLCSHSGSLRLWAGVRICQSERPEASTGTLPKSTRRFLRHFVIAIAHIPHRLRRESPHPGASTHSTHPLLVIYGTLEAIYDASEQWTTQFSTLEDLIVDLSPLATHPWLRQVIPVVGERFFDFFPSMTSPAHPTECLLLSPFSAHFRPPSIDVDDGPPM